METKTTISQVILNSGEKMPALGFGTAVWPIPSPEVLTPVFIDAIEIGYRHFDTASLYGTEEALGRAVAQAVERGIIGNRSEMFVTSKLWCCDAHPDLVVPALRASLERLGLEYLDLYLIHWPVRLKQGASLITSDEEVLPFDMKGTWEAMEECFRLGLAKSIGVSNFSTKKLNFLLENCTIPPSVNQVEMNVGWQQKQMVEFCKGKGIHVSAWSPLGALGTFYGSAAVIENPTLKEIALSKQKTLAQVALRWVLDQGASVVVKSFNKERMKQNLNVFGWELCQDEHDKIRQIPQKRIVTGHNFVHENGPIKSIEELWDSET